MFERPNIPKTEQQPPPSTSYGEFSKLEDEEKRELTTKTFLNFRELLRQNGYAEFAGVADLYKNLPHADYIVRREDPERVERLLAEGENYKIKHEGDTEYANSVEWNPGLMERGLENAYLEGYGNKNAVVVITGIRQGGDLQLKKLPESTPDFYGLDRRGVRSVTGEVAPDQVVFVSLRAPAHLLSEELLSDDELDALDEARESGSKKPVFIHRGYLRSTQ